MKQVRKELKAKNIDFELSYTWTKVLTKLKYHKGNTKYFKPVTEYDCFVWTDLNNYGEKAVSKIQFSRLKKV